MKLRETRNHPRLTIFLCFLLLVAMVAIIFAITDYARDEQPVAEQPSAQPGPIIAQETAGAAVDRAVGAAVEQYQTVDRPRMLALALPQLQLGYPGHPTRAGPTHQGGTRQS